MNARMFENAISPRTQRVIGLSFFFLFVVAVLVLVVLNPATALAQIDTGAIAGIIRDSQGAVISGATVTIRNVATGVVSSTKTNGDGEYQVLSLIPGNYSVEATMTGFGPAKNPAVEIHVRTRAQVDFTLIVGATQEQVDLCGRMHSAGGCHYPVRPLFSFCSSWAFSVFSGPKVSA